MALLSRPANLSKNVADTITIDYAELAALPAVPAGFYKNTNNWKEVFLKVKNKASGQKSVVHFVPPSTVGTLMVSDKARSGAWEIHSFVIRDFDRGEIIITKNQIPNQAALDFNVISGASHGDIYVGPGQTLNITANGFKQYGDFVIDAGGTLVLDDGGGILEIEVLGNCIINGTILGKQGKHTGGNWSKISSLGENLTFNVVQKAGGNGGLGESQDNPSPATYYGNWLFDDGNGNSGYIQIHPNGTYTQYQQGPSDGFGQTGTETGTYTFDTNTHVFVPTVTTDTNGEWGLSNVNGQMTVYLTNNNNNLEIYINGVLDSVLARSTDAIRIPASGQSFNLTTGSRFYVGPNAGGTLNWYWNNLLVAQTDVNDTTYTDGVFTYYKGTFVQNDGFGYARYGVYRTVGNKTVTPAGAAGLAANGNGGGGSRSAAFIALAGNDAIDVHAGAGAGASVYADEYGENGPDSTATLYGGGGGFRGAHGQAIYIKAQQIQGSGTIDVSGQKGGDGGAGNEYLSGGDLFANGAGGGAAGGNGGKVWLRAKSGTPALTINTIGGEKGVRGLSSSGATDAQHGTAGDNGSYDFSLF